MANQFYVYEINNFIILNTADRVNCYTLNHDNKELGSLPHLMPSLLGSISIVVDFSDSILAFKTYSTAFCKVTSAS